MHHGSDKQSAEDCSQEQQSESSSSDTKQVDDKIMTEVDGEIAYYIKKGTQFIPMTNFSVTCTGYVTENFNSECPEGFLFNVTSKTTILQADDEDLLCKR